MENTPHRPVWKIKGRRLRQEVLEILTRGNADPPSQLLDRFDPRQVISPLFSLILSTDPQVKWRAVTALGRAVAALARQDMESARVVVRRFMWQLNDESGGIGWGCPEAMAEALAQHEGLSREYAQVLVSYIREDGNFLEYEPLQRGAVWGIGRVAQVRCDLVELAVPHLLQFLSSGDAGVRGLAVWALGILGAREARDKIEALAGDTTQVEIYRDGLLERVALSDLAAEAVSRIEISLSEAES